MFHNGEQLGFSDIAWGTLFEDAEGTIGKLDEDLTSMNHIDGGYSYRICPEEQISIKEFDIVTEFTAYFFDIEDGFYEARFLFPAIERDEAISLFAEINERLRTEFPEEIHQYIVNKKTIEDSDGNLVEVVVGYQYRNLDDVTVRLNIGIEPSLDEKTNIVIYLTKDLPFKPERFEQSDKFSRDEIDAARKVVQGYVDGVIQKDEKEALSFVIESRTDAVTELVQGNIEKYNEHSCIVRGIVYDKDDIAGYDRAAKNDGFTEENSMMLRVSMYVISSEDIETESMWNFLLVRDDKDGEWYIYDEGFRWW